MLCPLFNFELRPLERIHPWGEPHDPNLHWFGLTDGVYWIQTEGSRLFEYSDSARGRLEAERFCDYQVVRLYEDVIELAPYALEPVPTELRRYIAVDESKSWRQDWTKWCAVVDSHRDSDQIDDVLDDAGTWIGCRTLDSGYLTPCTNVLFWSDLELVHVEWDNRDKVIGSRAAWTAVFGRWTLPRAEFIKEVRDFHERLMAQMAERVAQVAAGALSPRIRVDLDGLQREQHVRSQSIERNLSTPSPATDWSVVVKAIQTLEAWRSDA